MCSSGFLQGLIGSPTQCGLPVVVIVPLSLLAPGTHGHPSLSISTTIPTVHPHGHIAHWLSQCLAIRPIRAYRPTVHHWPSTMYAIPLYTNLVKPRISLVRHSNGQSPHITHDSSQYASIGRTVASQCSMYACVCSTPVVWNLAWPRYSLATVVHWIG